MANVNVKAVITAEDHATRVIKGFGQAVNRVNRIAKVAAVAGIGALTAAIGFSVREAIDSQKAVAQLDAVLKSTGKTAGVTKDAALELASSMQQLTTYSDEEILSAESLLLTFTKINKDIFPDTVKIVADMSTALGQDLKSSSIQVGKALQDPILGVTALRRVGVNFNKDQQEVIKNLVETGQSAKAQQMILKELNTEFGGSAAAAAQTFGGRLKNLQNNLGEIAETLGGLIIEQIEPFVVKLNEWVKNNQPQIKKALQDIVAVIKDMIGKIAEVIKFIARFKEAFIVLGAVLVSAQVIGAIIAVTTKIYAIAGAIKAVSVATWGLAAANPFAAVAIVALAAGVAIINKWRETSEVIQNTQVAISNSAVAVEESTRRMDRALKEGRISLGQHMRFLESVKQGQREVAETQSDQSYLLGIFDPSRRKKQHGGSVIGNMGYLVGENGPEMFVPPSGGGQIVPNSGVGKTNSTTINLNVNIGTFAGTPTERRKVAKDMLEALKDVASQQGTTLPNLIAT